VSSSSTVPASAPAIYSGSYLAQLCLPLSSPTQMPSADMGKLHKGKVRRKSGKGKVEKEKGKGRRTKAKGKKKAKAKGKSKRATNKKVKISSISGNRTRATSVKAMDPNHWTNTNLIQGNQQKTGKSLLAENANRSYPHKPILRNHVIMYYVLCNHGPIQLYLSIVQLYKSLVGASRRSNLFKQNIR
jgi:hypothetical protein